MLCIFGVLCRRCLPAISSDGRKKMGSRDKRQDATSVWPSIGWSGKPRTPDSIFVTKATTPKNWSGWSVYPWTDFAETPLPSTNSRDVSGTDIDAGWPKKITASTPSQEELRRLVPAYAGQDTIHQRTRLQRRGEVGMPVARKYQRRPGIESLYQTSKTTMWWFDHHDRGPDTGRRLERSTVWCFGSRSSRPRPLKTDVCRDVTHI